MKKLLSAMLLLPLIFINYYCNKTSPTDSEPPTRPEPPIQSDTATIINPNVRMIDSAILTLKNDTTLLNQGIYEFSFIGAPPNIKANDIIVGSTGEGYMKKVTAVTLNTGKIVFNTAQANLEDIFSQAQFSYKMSMEEMEENINNQFDLSGTVLYDDGTSRVDIESGNVSLKGNWTSDYTYRGFKLKSFTIDGKEIGFDAVVKLNASITKSGNLPIKNGSFKKFRKRIVVKVGWLPIVVTGILDFRYHFSGGVTNTLKRSLLFKNNSTLNLGLSYINGQWQNTYNPSSITNITPGPKVGNANGQINLSITPVLTIKILGIGSVDASIGLMEEIKGNATANSDALWDFYAGAWVRTTLGASPKPLGYSLDSTQKQWNTDSLFYKTPNKIEKAGGDNQKGPVNKFLPIPISVKVVDNFGAPESGVTVFFKAKDGHSSIQMGSVITNAEGEASTFWKMGSDTTIVQRAEANIKDGKDRIINTIDFTALATNKKVDTPALLVNHGTWRAYEGYEKERDYKFGGYHVELQRTDCGTVTFSERQDSLNFKFNADGTGTWSELLFTKTEYSNSSCGTNNSSPEWHHVNLKWQFIPELKIIRMVFIDDDFYNVDRGKPVDFKFEPFSDQGMILLAKRNSPEHESDQTVLDFMYKFK